LDDVVVPVVPAELPKKACERKITFKEVAMAVRFSTNLMSNALSKRLHCKILYASETGRSERFAKHLLEIFKHSFDPKLICMNEYDFANELEHETLVILVSSTFGNGEPPNNGLKFKEFLAKKLKKINHEKSDTLPLTNLKYTVFGLGNSSYPKFCLHGKYLDESFEALGAQRIVNLGIGDELSGQEESFRSWSVQVYKKTLQVFNVEINNSSICGVLKDNSLWSCENVRLVLNDNKQETEEALCEKLSKFHGRKVLPCTFKGKQNISKVTNGRQTLLVEILVDPEHADDFEYSPGDHFGIYPENSQDLVDRILARLTEVPPSPDQAICVMHKAKSMMRGDEKAWTIDERYPKCTLRSAFQFYLDITTPPTQKMLLYLSTQASSDADKIALEKLGKDEAFYETWKHNDYPNLAQVLDEFQSCRPNASLLITQLPTLQPRFYSISSSPKISKNVIQLTLGVFEYPTANKSAHFGVCSKWLDRAIEMETQVPSFIRKSMSFHMPDDITAPIVMVATGTGIAPYRSFWLERNAQMEEISNNEDKSAFGNIHLYFGCRQFDNDDLYSDDINKLMEKNVISKYYTAFSRDPNFKKTYVQNLMAENMKELFDAIFVQNGHFYVCGDIKMANDVTQTLELILQTHGNMSEEQAKSTVLQLRADRRFHDQRINFWE
jgi:sulfite reductase alpha subunit-like flavoprotein